ncbi:MAG: hypothetical protein FJX68_17575 [Alphaproteobacteria bacterium]|nr:hypothetical protein [Alphaproteobacteria bacterium]
MFIALHDVFKFVHVLLFGYWLGADLGVFFCDSQMTRQDLDIEERLRVRRIRYKVDLAPRTCFVLIIAFGFSLALRFGSPVDGWWLALVWLICLAWLALIFAARLRASTPSGRLLARLDRWVWRLTAVSMTGLGAYALATGQLFAGTWLACKVLLFGLIGLNALWIMWAGDRWYPLIEDVRAGGERRQRAEALMKVNRLWAGASAGTLWFLVLVMAFLGTVKPF